MTNTSAPTLLKSCGLRDHAIRNGKGCPCCCDYGSTKAGARNRQIARQAQRQRERRQWRSENI